MKLITITLLFTLLAQAKVLELKINITNLEPWLKTRNGRCVSGPICELFMHLDKKETISIKYKELPIARTNIATYEGKQDIALFPKLPIFEKYYEPLAEYYKYQLGHYNISNNNKTKSICTVSKSPHKDPAVKYVEVSSMKQCFQMLEKKRITDILLTDFEVKIFTKKYPKLNVGKFHSIKDLSLWFYINKKFSPEKKAIILNEFKTMNIQDVQKKY